MFPVSALVLFGALVLAAAPALRPAAQGPRAASPPAATSLAAFESDPADAEITSETVDVTVSPDGSALESGTRVIRILTEAGLDQATVQFAVMPLTELTSIGGVLTTPDGKEHKLEPQRVIERPLLDGAVAREVKIIQASFPLASPGSSIRVSWVRRLRSLFYLEPWTFRGPLPLKRSTFKIQLPPGMPFRWRAWNGEVTPVEAKDEYGTAWTFEVRDAKAVGAEPFSPALWNLVGRVELVVGDPPGRCPHNGTPSNPDSWESVASFYDGLADGHYELDPTLAAEMKALGRQIKDRKALVEKVYGRLRDFRYVQVYLGMGGFQPHAAMWTWKRHYGDCKDLATMFIAMCRAAGVTANPVLTRAARGDRFVEAFPSPKQFDHCIARVELPEGPVIVDATAPEFPFGMLPSTLAGKPGLVVRGNGQYELTRLPAVSPERNLVTTVIDLAPAPGGGFVGDLKSRLEGDRLAWGRHLMASGNDELEGGELGYLLDAPPRGAKATGVSLREAEGAVEATARIDLALPAATAAGHRTLLTPGIVADEHRVQAFALPTRQHPIDLGSPGESRLRATFRVPGRASCPAPAAAEGPFGRYRLTCEVLDGAVVFERTLLVSRPWIDPEDYAAARPFWLAVLSGDRSAAIVEAAP